ncbi:hypothetical protein FBUS_04708 [Fasciolopsis buskii]|uniref:Uncharacterized protein n=1 Tax=Fasciolopsis buskii TaxID=27845 RepID=A0A8E0RV70_9TREM|nr:hypothetical protein FBUS_04708 [Fasciolopsis buski]
MQSECNTQRTQATSPVQPTPTGDSTLDRNVQSPASIEQQQMSKQMQQQQRMAVDTRSSLSQSDTMSGAGAGNTNTGSGIGIPGAAFNTTPIYDAQGSLVGLQAPVESSHPLDEYNNTERTDHMSYMGMSPVYQYNMSPHPGGQMLPVEYYPYTNYGMNQPQGAYSPSFVPAHPHSQEQHYHQLLQHQQQQQQQQQHQQQHAQHHEQQQKLLMTNTTGNGTATIIRGLPKHQLSFDKCPAVCSLFAILCCPITLWCSLPALIYSMCAYTDYRTRDLERYQRKSDIARHLVITACVIGLLLCVTWAVLAFFYYAVIIATIHDVMRVISHRLGIGT